MAAFPQSPVAPFLKTSGVLVLDGGLATELERRGYDLSDELWSARLLLEAPEAIREVHADYLAAGADCIITASYQATIPGFMSRGLREKEAIELIQLSVQLAIEARDAFWVRPENRPGRLRPLVAASVGPYGAFLADGSEYRGDYGVSEEELLAFHRHRWHILARSHADLLACETIPSYLEARALARLLAETPDRYAWFSFTGRDDRAISDGTPLAECAAFLDGQPQVAAIGINCTPPRHIPGLIAEIREVSHKPIVVYPNSGERYDPIGKRWQDQSVPAEFGTLSREWRKAGAALIGGCCRTGPAHVRAIRDRFPVRD